MIYGRVIGNELRDIPPECFPIWGQRWSGYRAPHGPSPFSTRILNADQMTEVGPVLTSPTQFEAAFAEDDEWEDAWSESSQPYSSFSSSPLTNPMVATELTPQPGTPMPRFVRCSPNHPYERRRSIGNPLLQDSICIGTLLLPRGEFEYPGTQHHTSESLFHASVLPHDGILGQGGCRTLDNDYTSSDLDHGSSSTQLQPLQDNRIPGEQMQCTLPSYPIPEWQLTNAHVQSSAYSFQPNSLPHPSQPFHADGQTSLDSTPPRTSSRFSARGLPRHNHDRDVGIDSSWNHESNITTIPGIASLNNHMMTQWSSELVPSDLSFSPPSQISGPSFDPGSFHPLVSDHPRDSSDPEYLLSTLPYVGSPTLLSLDRLRDNQHTR